MKGSRKALVTLFAPVVIASGCVTAARVFFDIPESVADAGDSGSRIPEDLLEQIQLKPTPPPPPEIESVTDPDSVLALLPSDHSGGVDWVAAVESGVIRPRSGRSAEVSDSLGDFSYDLYLSDSGGPEAYFPHSAHRVWLDCVSCHPRVYRNGAESATAETAHSGSSCGYCHGPVAFPIHACERCHEKGGDLPANRRDKAVGGVKRLQRVGSGTFADASSSYPPASFPHNQHRLRFQCRACHEQPFAMVAGGATMTSDVAHSSKGCAKCHNGQAAFAIDPAACYRCHVTEEGDGGGS